MCGWFTCDKISSVWSFLPKFFLKKEVVVDGEEAVASAKRKTAARNPHNATRYEYTALHRSVLMEVCNL